MCETSGVSTSDRVGHSASNFKDLRWAVGPLYGSSTMILNLSSPEICVSYRSPVNLEQYVGMRNNIRPP